jgi:hypothetical protein
MACLQLTSWVKIYLSDKNQGEIMKQKIINAVIENKDNLPYIHIDENNQFKRVLNYDLL